jgi:hypothetical protein
MSLQAFGLPYLRFDTSIGWGIQLHDLIWGWYTPVMPVSQVSFTIAGTFNLAFNTSPTMLILSAYFTIVGFHRTPSSSSIPSNRGYYIVCSG